MSEHLATTSSVPELQVYQSNPDAPKEPEADTLQTLGILSIACAGLIAIRRGRSK